MSRGCGVSLRIGGHRSLSVAQRASGRSRAVRHTFRALRGLGRGMGWQPASRGQRASEFACGLSAVCPDQEIGKPCHDETWRGLLVARRESLAGLRKQEERFRQRYFLMYLKYPITRSTAAAVMIARLITQFILGGSAIPVMSTVLFSCAISEDVSDDAECC